MRSLLIFVLIFCASVARAHEVQGFLTSACKLYTGMVVYVDDDSVEFIDLSGHLQKLPQDHVENVFVYNVIDNPIETIHVDEDARARLKSVYVDDSEEPRTVAFPVRFIEDLVIFYSLDGRSHVHPMKDIFKLRPASEKISGPKKTTDAKVSAFEVTAQSSRCSTQGTAGKIKPTRVLADKISISDFFRSLRQGYESLESFQERTYLYARPLLFDQHTRLGLVFESKREEPGVPFPFYFQWSTGEAYRFQSRTVIGGKSQEWLPNAEPVASIRSDVKSHLFHAVFIGSLAGVSAGSSVFLEKGLVDINDQVTVDPGFNYLAMMGADYGPYTASIGFFYPTFAIKVRDERREVLGAHPSYALRAMYTGAKIRLRAIASYTHYDNSAATKDDVLARTGESDLDHPESYEFSSTFWRAGVDYDFSKALKVSLDGILLQGNYKEVRATQSSDIKFDRVTVQGSVTQSFSDYVSITGYVDLVQHTFESNFLNIDQDREQRETRAFATFEFIF
jgi:hypothetical protein